MTPQAPLAARPVAAPIAPAPATRRRLPVGEQADIDTDCIRTEELADGSYRLTGTALCSGEDEGSSVSLMNGLNYATSEQAEAAGLAWAESVGVQRLHISTGTLEQPLQLSEIDLPG